MAIIFNYNIRNLLMHTGIHCGANTVNPSTSTTTSVWGLTILSGVQPSAATITSTWTNYNTTYLYHVQNVTLATSFSNTPGAPQGLILDSTPSSVAAENSGTASWGIMWPTNPTEVTIQSSSLPSTRFIVLPVTDTLGTGPIRLTSTAIVAASSYTIQDFSMVAGGGIA